MSFCETRSFGLRSPRERALNTPAASDGFLSGWDAYVTSNRRARRSALASPKAIDAAIALVSAFKSHGVRARRARQRDVRRQIARLLGGAQSARPKAPWREMLRKARLIIDIMRHANPLGRNAF